jgi:phosphoribosylglycinamide formyltransferase-1
MKSLVILISGRGSNMQVLLKAKLPIEIITVISSNPDAEGLSIAKSCGVNTIVVDHRIYSNRVTFDEALAKQIDSCQPDLIALAGFMRILGDDFVSRYQGRLMNIHPSLLPAFPGLDTHARVLQEGVRIHGCTVHFVTCQLDHGPIVIQAAIAILPDDTEKTLAARILQQEHRIYPQAVRWFVENRLKLSLGHVGVSKAPICRTVLYSPGLQE